MKRKRSISNRSYDNPVYIAACEAAGIKPTPRQASKWRNFKGLARKFARQAFEKLAQESKDHA